MEQSGGTLARVMVVFLAVGIGAAGLYGFQNYRTSARLEAERNDIQGKLASCTKSQDDEKRAREATEKTATATIADLNASRAELEELRKEKEETDKRLAIFRAVTEKFRKMIDSGKLQVTVRHGRMVVKLPAGVLFPSGSAELSKEGKDALTEVAHILKQFPERRFEVAGHTDNVPIAPPSPFKNNLELSTGRALTVAEFLTSAGMNPSRLSAAGYSEHQPVASNSKEAGRQENRRIEIVLQPNLAELPNLHLEGDGGASKEGAVAAPAAADAGAAEARRK
jgi:chemotaxis protein MotB